MEICTICQGEFRNARSLSCHIRHDHKIDSETYWNLTNTRPTCRCGNSTRFESLTAGYKNHCSPKCACTTHRENLKGDHEKFSKFTAKVSERMSKTWEQRKADGTAEEIHRRVGQTLSRRNQALTPYQRRKRFNYNPGGYYPSLGYFWETASEERKEEVRRKALWAIASANPPAEDDPEEFAEWYEKNNERLERLICG